MTNTNNLHTCFKCEGKGYTYYWDEPIIIEVGAIIRQQSEPCAMCLGNGVVQVSPVKVEPVKIEPVSPYLEQLRNS